MTATFDDGDVIRARYVVGADGIHSTVREQAGIGFEGGAYQESFALADVRLRGEVPADEVILFWAKAGLTVVAPLPGDIYRIVAPVAEAPEEPSVAFIQQILDDRGLGAGRMVVTEVIWGSRFRIHHRVADTYRAGRLLLAGDAAHVHSPAGGQGMNLGIQDAVALADALAACARRRARQRARRVQRRAPPDRAAGRRNDRPANAIGDAAAGRASDPQCRHRRGGPDPGRSPCAGDAAQRAGVPLTQLRVAARCGSTAPRSRRSPRPLRSRSPAPSASTADLAAACIPW